MKIKFTRSCKSLTAIIAFGFLLITSYSFGNILSAPKIESSDFFSECRQINERKKYFSDNSAFFQSDTIKGTPDEKIVKSNSDPANKNDQITSIDSTKYNMFDDLLKDNPAYIRKMPIWEPVLGIITSNFMTNVFDTYVIKEPFSRVGFVSWGTTLKAGAPWGNGWMWDRDRFGNNFLSHPYGGSIFFNCARVNGYNYWESAPYALIGSYMWKIFGETGTPEREDLINTTFTGMFMGEMIYRLSSNILDDRTTGAERFFRELGAAALNPTRFVYRLLQGKLTRVTTEEIYAKEPLNIELSAGFRRINEGSKFLSGTPSAMFNFHFDYGYPFEKRDRLPFDYFKLRSEIDFGSGRKLVNLLTGYGVLFAKNINSGDVEMLIGLFQHYNYFDNKIFELGTLGLGGGIMTKYSIKRDVFLFTNLFLSAVPFGGNSKRLGPDTSQIRDYNFVGGMETKVESGVDIGWGSIQLIGYYFWLHAYEGELGNTFVALLKPRITIKLYRNVSIGFEQSYYFADRYTFKFGNYHTVNTEQRIYLVLNVGNFKL